MKLDMEKYKKVRMAQVKGARTLDELKELSDINIENEEEEEQIEIVIRTACRCKDVSIKEVLDAIKNGADSLEKIMEVTKAGTACGRCKPLLENILETRR